MLNFRVTEEEAETLAAYAEQAGQSMTDVIRAFIRALGNKMSRVDPKTVRPELLPSVPLAKTAMIPPVAAVYFILTESGDVLYVGQCANMAVRHSGLHHRHAESLEIDAHTRIHWLERRASRETFERACIKRFKPRLNRSSRG